MPFILSLFIGNYEFPYFQHPLKFTRAKCFAYATNLSNAIRIFFFWKMRIIFVTAFFLFLFLVDSKESIRDAYTKLSFVVHVGVNRARDAAKVCFVFVCVCARCAAVYCVRCSIAACTHMNWWEKKKYRHSRASCSFRKWWVLFFIFIRVYSIKINK